MITAVKKAGTNHSYSKNESKILGPIEPLVLLFNKAERESYPSPNSGGKRKMRRPSDIAEIAHLLNGFLNTNYHIFLMY